MTAEPEPDEMDGLGVEVAVQMVKRLDGQEELAEAELEQLREEVGLTGELAGYSYVIYALAKLIDDHPAQFTVQEPNRRKVFTTQSLIAAAVDSLVGHDVREQDVPTAAGALVAASQGVPPSIWRRRLGPLDTEELPAWCRLAWFMSTFVDGARQHPGLALGVVLDTVMLAAEDGQEPGEHAPVR